MRGAGDNRRADRGFLEKALASRKRVIRLMTYETHGRRRIPRLFARRSEALKRNRIDGPPNSATILDRREKNKIKG
jgi:hypothetical protein